MDKKILFLGLLAFVVLFLGCVSSQTQEATETDIDAELEAPVEVDVELPQAGQKTSVEIESGSVVEEPLN